MRGMNLRCSNTSKRLVLYMKLIWIIRFFPESWISNIELEIRQQPLSLDFLLLKKVGWFRGNWYMQRTSVASQVSGKGSACHCKRYRRQGFDPWVGKITWRRKWQPLQYSYLENPMDRGAWWATIYGVAKIWTGLSDWAFIQGNFCTLLYVGFWYLIKIAIDTMSVGFV